MRVNDGRYKWRRIRMWKRSKRGRDMHMEKVCCTYNSGEDVEEEADVEDGARVKSVCGIACMWNVKERGTRELEKKKELRQHKAKGEGAGGVRNERRRGRGGECCNL